MKKVLILAIGCSLKPWDKMFSTSLNTWDSVEVDGAETIFYFGSPLKQNTDKAIYFDIPEAYATMGHKMLRAFEWALENKKFDYIARVNSSCFVDKKQLIKYVQGLPDSNVFSGTEVEGSPNWMWGGSQFILSKDVVQKLVENQGKWNHDKMEDVAISNLATDLGIPFHAGKSCSLNEHNGKWLCIGYGSESIEFENFECLKALRNHFYRVKIDRDRNVDEYLMHQLYKTLK